ncbi:MAG: hypothetical protein OEW04_04865 [Nitrospirota bacterium]|nr:hypothetical protein [Nitrospirota bacterium]
MLTHDDKIRLSRTAEGEELWQLVRDSSPDIIMNAVLNKSLTEEMAVFIAKQKKTPSEVLGMLASDMRYKGSYSLKLSLCKNPGTPQKIVLSLLKYLRIFDLGDLTKDRNIPITVRQKMEYSIAEKIAALPSGVKVALAKRSSLNIIFSLLEKGDTKVINSCLESPLLTEDHLCKLIHRPDSKPLLIKILADHPKWSLRYKIRYALTRNYHTPMTSVTKFIATLKTTDLRDLYSDNSLPPSTKPYLFNELAARNESVEIFQEEIYNLSGDEDSGFSGTDLQS